MSSRFMMRSAAAGAAVDGRAEVVEVAVVVGRRPGEEQRLALARPGRALGDPAQAVLAARGVGGQALDRLQRPAVAALAHDGVAGQQRARVAHEAGEVDADGADLAAGAAGQAVPEGGLQRRAGIEQRRLPEQARRVECGRRGSPGRPTCTCRSRSSGAGRASRASVGEVVAQRVRRVGAARGRGRVVARPHRVRRSRGRRRCRRRTARGRSRGEPLALVGVEGADEQAAPPGCRASRGWRAARRGAPWNRSWSRPWRHSSGGQPSTATPSAPCRKASRTRSSPTRPTQAVRTRTPSPSPRRPRR